MTTKPKTNICKNELTVKNGVARITVHLNVDHLTTTRTLKPTIDTTSEPAPCLIFYTRFRQRAINIVECGAFCDALWEKSLKWRAAKALERTGTPLTFDLARMDSDAEVEEVLFVPRRGALNKVAKMRQIRWSIPLCGADEDDE